MLHMLHICDTHVNSRTFNVIKVTICTWVYLQVNNASCYRLYRWTVYHFLFVYLKKSQTTDFIHVYSLLLKFSDFNQSKASTEIFPDAVLAEILPVATSPRVPKSQNHASQDILWKQLNFERNGLSRSIGEGGTFIYNGVAHSQPFLEACKILKWK